MNLQIKLIDIVTLLFVTLLVVIIIFITLQRNIKRYKLRNIKDPHFHICKSIPQELRDNIAAKHAKSNIYREPQQLFSSSYHYLSPEQTKPFVLRLKAYDTSKNLENALYDCGYYRGLGTKFEDFLMGILNERNEVPKGMLKQFIFYYKWILSDPKVFEVTDLRNMNQLINRIIQQLSIKFNNDKILRHQLDLEPNGDYNIEIKLNPLNSNDNLSNANTNFANANNQGIEDVDSNNDSSIARKIIRSLSKLKLSKNSKMNNNETEVLFNKNYETKIKFKKSSSAAAATAADDGENLVESENKTKKSKNKTKLELDNLNRWSIINESLKTFNDDSDENEEIPLVFKDKKATESSTKFSNNKKFESNF